MVRSPSWPLLVAVIVVGLVALGGIAVLTSPPGKNTDGFSSRPFVTLTAARTFTGADILVAGIQPATAPGNFRVNMENGSSATYGLAAAMPTTSGSSVSVTVGTGPRATQFLIYWQNTGGSGLVSQGDHFAVIWASGAYATGTGFWFLLLWSDGSTLASAGWQV